MRESTISGTCLQLDGAPWAQAVVHAVQHLVFGVPGRQRYSTVSDSDGRFCLEVPPGSRFVCWAESQSESDCIEVSACREYVEGGDRLTLEVFPRGPWIDLKFANLEAWGGYGRLFAHVVCAHSIGIGCYHEVPTDGEVRDVRVPILGCGPPDEWYEVRLFTEEGAYIRGFFVRSDGMDRTWGKAKSELILYGPSRAEVRLIGQPNSPVPQAEVYAQDWLLQDVWKPLHLRFPAGTLEVLTDHPGRQWAGLTTYYLVRCHGYADRFVGRREIEAGEANLECGHELIGQVVIGDRALPQLPLVFFTDVGCGKEDDFREGPPFLTLTGQQGEIRVGGRHARLGHRICGLLTSSDLTDAFGSCAENVRDLVILHAGFERDTGVLDLREFGSWTIEVSNGAGAEILLLEDMGVGDLQKMPSRPLKDQLDKSGTFSIGINPEVHLLVFIWDENGYWMGRVQLEPRQHIRSQGELRPAGRISGCVLDVDAQPLAGVPVCIQSNSPETSPMGTSGRSMDMIGYWSSPCWTDVHGRFEMDVPTPGAWLIEVCDTVVDDSSFWFSPGDYQSVEQDIMVDGSVVNLI